MEESPNQPQLSQWPIVVHRLNCILLALVGVANLVVNNYFEFAICFILAIILLNWLEIDNKKNQNNHGESNLFLSPDTILND